LAGLPQVKDRFKLGEVVVVIFHHHGTRYLGKMFNPEWMRQMGYENLDGPTARSLVRTKKVADLVGVEETATVQQALVRMAEHDFSQIPVTKEDRIVGSLRESHVYASLVRNPVDVIHPGAVPGDWTNDIRVGTDIQRNGALDRTGDGVSVVIREHVGGSGTSCRRRRT
jgi:CBS domain-containing protein